MPDHDERPGHEFENSEVKQLRRIADEFKKFNGYFEPQLELICKALQCICKALQPPSAVDFQLVQGENMGAIVGIQAGSSDFFTASLVPANSAALQSGPTFSVTDPLVVLTVDPVNPFKVTAAVDATDAAASFDLKVDGTTTNGPITHTFTIPILQAPPPQAVDFDLSQGA